MASNTQQATEVAYGRQRFRVVMVTLGGELIETTGTMTGGGRSKISGKMGQQSAVVDKISPREFEKMERSINEVEEETRGAEARRQELDEFVFRTKKEIQEMKR